MSLSILMFGRTGQVATELARRGGAELRVEALDRAAANLEDPEACAKRVAATDADIVVNAAAYTAVDRAETEPDRAATINAAAPGAMARAAARRGLPFLHISTDYVFDGSGERAWRESDATGPLGAYGRSKLDGENEISAADGPHLILRTAWVHSAQGENFVRTMLRVGAQRDVLRIVDDQRGGPTPAAAIADALIAAARAFAAGRGVSGVFHFAGAPTTSWAGFAAEIFRQATARGALRRAPRIEPIATEEWPTPAARPRNSVLDCAAFEAAYGVAQPDWRRGLGAIVDALADGPPAE